MNLKDFVKDVLIQLNEAVDEARNIASRDIHFSEKDNMRTVEFDIAVSAEDTDIASGKTGIKVLQFAEAGGSLSKETKNATVSRVSFGLQVEYATKQEDEVNTAAAHRYNGAAGRNTW